MSVKTKLQAQNPLILRCHRLMEAFAKSDDERDFYVDRTEGFLIFVDLDKSTDELGKLENELEKNNERYCMIPKLTFYETKKIMEGFVNEKVYDIDTKEKLLEIIQSKEARENFLEFIYDHHSELEKWQQFYQERSRIRIIEWLRQNHFEFVFEEDLELPRDIIEKLKGELFEPKAGKEVLAARKTLFLKAKTYYSNEALNPRPKRGRPPKQVVKLEVEPQVTTDIYTSVPPAVRPFLFIPDYSHGSSIIFSPKFESEEQLMARKKATSTIDYDISVESLNQKLSALRNLSHRWLQEEARIKKPVTEEFQEKISFEDEVDEEEEDAEEFVSAPKSKPAQPKKPALNNKAANKAKAPPAQAKNKPAPKKAAPVKKPLPKAKNSSKPKLISLRKTRPTPKAKIVQKTAKKAPPSRDVRNNKKRK